MNRQDIPNLLTGLRIVLAVAVLLMLLVCAGALPGQGEIPPAGVRAVLLTAAFAAWVVGAATGAGWAR